ncbi:DUF6286 domain-containing protein [Saccharomonospora iraqiensis]|uniref:DUF6286 domain-containing protein n=1 Tax=Saccharomonospora iraqiensis TaxID=52698 RepID=UPI00040046E4|nr:DUF6286 domain-containing protein [Saccharomonospora iraqiensis]
MRFVNRLLATLLSLALIAGGLLLIIEVVAAGFGVGPVLWDWQALVRWAETTSWSDVLIQVIAVICLVVGLLLLIAELKRPRVRRLRARPVTDSSDARPVDAAYTRRGVATAVRSAVTGVDGIRSAKVTVKRRRVRVQAATASEDRAAVAELRRSAQQAARSRIEQLELRSSPSVTIRTRSA